MRSPKSRSRGKNNRNRSSGNNINRVFDSSGPEGKVRGTPQQIIEKYAQLTRDAQLSNDRVAAENFQQHAEHYARILGEAQREAEAKRAEQEAQHKARQAQREAAEAEQPEMAQAVPAENTDQPDTVAVADSGLVETPEAKPKPKRARRTKPKADPLETVDTSGEDSGDTNLVEEPNAAE